MKELKFLNLENWGEMLHQPKEEYRKKRFILSRENLIQSWEGRIRGEHVNPIGNSK